MKGSMCVRFFSLTFSLPSLSPAQPCRKKSLWGSVLRLCLPWGPSICRDCYLGRAFPSVHQGQELLAAEDGPGAEQGCLGRMCCPGRGGGLGWVHVGFMLWG